MKKIFASVLTLSLLVVLPITSISFPEKASEGKIRYDVEVIELQLSYLEEMMIGTASLSISFREEFIRTDFNATVSETTVIQDGKANQGLMLMSIMGMKKAIKLDDQKRDEKVNPNIEYLSETKTIAGHKCKKAVVVLDDGTKLSVFYSDQIMPKNMDSKYTYGDLKGFPLEMEVKQEGMKLKLTADLVDLSPQNAANFTLDIPEGYELTTFEELEKMGAQ